MAKRRQRVSIQASTAAEKRMRQWRGCGILALGIGIMGILLYVGVRLFRDDGAAHGHRPGAHGGTLVPIGDDENHYHVEFVAEKGGGIALYTLGDDADKIVDVELQTLQARINRADAQKSFVVSLMPMPQSGDAEGRTSRFVGKVPRELRGEPLEITVSEITIMGKSFRVQFTSPESHEPEGGPALAQDEEALFLTPGGKYTGPDIEANGANVPSRKYRTFRANHDVRPKRGEKICPVTRTKANPTCTWVIDGAVYEFCCPPCIDEFVRRAKEQPEKIKPPEKYVKK